MESEVVAAVRLRRILLNLVGNAVKFTKNGRITISISEPPDRPSVFTFSVNDTSCGILAALTAHILQIDQQRFMDAGMNDYLNKPIEVANVAAWGEKGSEKSPAAILLPMSDLARRFFRSFFL